ncbi:MAG: DUF559 domain-containing protein [Phycisphaera sp.]|nr:DUF559 domain-containing protein [Phycisphaera sp.]
MTDQPKMHRLSPRTTARARSLRKDSSTPERVLWGYLRDRRLDGFKFRRQFPIGPYVAGFCCPDTSLIVELDGDSHIGRADYDERRADFIRNEGYRVLRIAVQDMIDTPDAVAETILHWCEHSDRIDIHAPNNGAPIPSPSEGEGQGEGLSEHPHIESPRSPTPHDRAAVTKIQPNFKHSPSPQPSPSRERG